MIKSILFFTFVACVFSGSTRQRDLSDVGHHIDAEIHDMDYDHKAFLGKNEAEEYSELTPEESKIRLRKLIEKKVDVNKDGKVTKTELKDWIAYISRKWMLEERDRVWTDMNSKNQTYLDFKSYSDMSFGEKLEERYSGEELNRVKKDIELDKQKWQLADSNNDGLLDIEEFFGFVRPEEVPRMKPFLIDEMLVRADKNRDGYVDLDEYTDELYTRVPGVVRGKDPEPEWIEYEVKHFSVHRDMSGDMRMDRKEIGEWIQPTEYDGVDAEANHLMGHADIDKDGVLSVQEIVDHSDLFAGSQATNYGSTLKNKEEL